MQITNAQYESLKKASVRPLSWNVRMSFEKGYDESVQFFTVDQSQLDGTHILKASPEEEAELQRWDLYEYTTYSERVMAVEWTRSMQFPSSVTAAMADFTLDNFNDYFTPNGDSPISQYILPKRPVRITAGFGTNRLQQFVGLTETMPEIDRNAKTAKFHAVDFLAQMYSRELNDTIAMTNVRTDEVLAVIFAQFGLQPVQYDLDPGFNVIPFVYFEKGKNAGNVFRDLMEAEMGNLWLNEVGVIRFEPRIIVSAPVVETFSTANTAAIKIIDEDNIINVVNINADIRKLMGHQKIYEKSDSTGEDITVTAGQSLVFEAGLDDPALNVTTPANGRISGDSWYTAQRKDDGTPVTTGVSITGSVLRTNNLVMFFQNDNEFDVTIDAMELWGQPARVIDRIRYTLKNQASVDKYDEQPIEIENNFIQTIDTCDALALTILDSFSEYYSAIELTVKGDFARQLGDKVFVDIAGYEGEYKITKITNRIQDGGLTQRLEARKQTPRDFFVVEQSQLDGTDVLMF